MQALLASGPYCQYLKALRRIQLALTDFHVPTLLGLSRLADEFKAAEPVAGPSGGVGEGAAANKKGGLRTLGNGVTLPNKGVSVAAPLHPPLPPLSSCSISPTKDMPYSQVPLGKRLVFLMSSMNGKRTGRRSRNFNLLGS